MYYVHTSDCTYLFHSTQVIMSTREWNKLHLCCYDFTSSDVWTIYFGSEGACFPSIAVHLHAWKSQVLFIVTSFRAPPVRFDVVWGLYTVYTNKKAAYITKREKTLEAYTREFGKITYSIYLTKEQEFADGWFNRTTKYFNIGNMFPNIVSDWARYRSWFLTQRYH